LPSVIHDGSIGRGVRVTSRLVVSINAPDIIGKPQWLDPKKQLFVQLDVIAAR
jgi:hypothetical protein